MLPPRTRRCRQPTGLDLPPGTSYLGMTPHHTPSMIMKVPDRHGPTSSGSRERGRTGERGVDLVVGGHVAPAAHRTPGDEPVTTSMPFMTRVGRERRSASVAAPAHPRRRHVIVDQHIRRNQEAVQFCAHSSLNILPPSPERDTPRDSRSPAFIGGSRTAPGFTISCPPGLVVIRSLVQT